MTKENIENIIEILEHVRKNSSMYFGYEYSFETIIHYLHGFHMALFALNFEFPRPHNDKDGWYTSYITLIIQTKSNLNFFLTNILSKEFFLLKLKCGKHLVIV